MSIHNYTKTVNLSQLGAEIGLSPLSSITLQRISAYGTEVSIDFLETLSAGQITTLDSIVSAHNPQAEVPVSLIQTLTKSDVGLSNVDNISDANKPISTATQNALDLKANLASPTFTGTVGGITKAMVGLPNVDNTSDANKPISTATQTALNLKANIASPTFTGTVGGITKAMVGLSAVDNTSDVDKPISTATQTALNGKEPTISPKNTAFNTNFGTTNGTTCAGNDSRLSDDRTASGIRTNSNIVALSTANAPTLNQVLRATSSSSATWQDVSIMVQEEGVNIANTPHTTLNFGPGVVAQDSGGGVARVIGLANNFQFLESASDLTGNSANQNKVSMDFICGETGTYRIGYKICIRSTNTIVRTAIISLVVDSVTYTSVNAVTSMSSTGKATYTGVDYITLNAGTRVINLVFNSPNTCIASNAWIEVWRVS